MRPDPQRTCRTQYSQNDDSNSTSDRPKHILPYRTRPEPRHPGCTRTDPASSPARSGVPPSLATECFMHHWISPCHTWTHPDAPCAIGAERISCEAIFHISKRRAPSPKSRCALWRLRHSCECLHRRPASDMRVHSNASRKNGFNRGHNYCRIIAEGSSPRLCACRPRRNFGCEARLGLRRCCNNRCDGDTGGARGSAVASDGRILRELLLHRGA